MKKLDFYLNLPYTTEIIKDEFGGYFVKVKELLGCMSQGETEGEAIEMINDAKKLWLEVAIERGIAIPEPRGERDVRGTLRRSSCPSTFEEFTYDVAACYPDWNLYGYAQILVDLWNKSHPKEKNEGGVIRACENKDKMIKTLRSGNIKLWNRWRSLLKRKGIVELNLSYANLKDLDLESADLSNVCFSYSTFAHSKLTKVNFSNSNLHDSNMVSSKLESANITNCDLSKVDFSETLYVRNSHQNYRYKTGNIDNGKKYIMLDYITHTVKEWERAFWNKDWQHPKDSLQSYGKVEAYLLEFKKICPGEVSEQENYLRNKGEEKMIQDAKTVARAILEWKFNGGREIEQKSLHKDDGWYDCPVNDKYMEVDLKLHEYRYKLDLKPWTPEIALTYCKKDAKYNGLEVYIYGVSTFEILLSVECDHEEVLRKAKGVNVSLLGNNLIAVSYKDFLKFTFMESDEPCGTKQ